MTFQLANNAATTLASGITNVATSLTVSTGKGALFPTPSGANVFRATLIRASDGAVEIVEVTARSTDTFTITRGLEGTTGIAFSTGDKVELRATTAVLNALATQAGFVDKGNSGTTAQTLDYSAGQHQKLTVTGSFTMNAPSNWPATGNSGMLMLELVNGASATITWPGSINWVKSDGSFTTSFASNGVTLQSSGTDFVLLWTRDSGTTTFGKVVR